jgi:hypothetical protein
MLFLGVGAVMFTATLFIGGWVLYDQFFRNDTKDATESEVPVFAYHHESEILQQPTAGIKYLVEDDEGIDADQTLSAVMQWVQADEPNIWTGDWQVRVNTWNDAGVIQIHGDASTLIEDRYDDVALPYFTGDGFLEQAIVDLEFT